MFKVGENVYALPFNEFARIDSKLINDGCWVIRSDGSRYWVEIDQLVASRESKPSNPKDAIGSDKLPLHLWPTTATAMGCLGLLEGALKYGRNNFRESGVRTSIYIDACKRHLDAYMEGEDHAPPG